MITGLPTCGRCRPHIVVVVTLSDESLELRNGVKVASLIKIKVMFSAWEERDCRKPAEALATPSHEVSSVVPPNTD